MSVTSIIYTFMVVFACVSLPVFGNPADSTGAVSAVNTGSVSVSYNTFSNELKDKSESFTPGNLLLTLMGFAFMVFCIGFGIVITIVCMVLVFGLISLGIISTSVFVGLNQRSVTKGFKTFFILLSSVFFLFIGAGCAWLLNLFVNWWSVTTAILIGGSIGLAAGILLGILAYYIVRGMVGMYSRKLAGKVVNAKGFKRNV